MLTKLTEADRRRLIKKASEGLNGYSGIVKALKLPVKGRRVRQNLQDAQYLTYKVIIRMPPMREHREQRLFWAEEGMTRVQQE